jgi:hypothetical protein
VEETNCPFYGYHLYRTTIAGPTPFLLLGQGGNQCALVTVSYKPCHMEMNHVPVDWRKCPYVADIRVGLKVSHENSIE